MLHRHKLSNFMLQFCHENRPARAIFNHVFTMPPFTGSQVAPRAPPILVMLADCLVQGGKTDEALVLYRKAVALVPDEPEPRMRLAALLAYRGDRAEARELYRSLLRAGVRDPLVIAGLIEVS